MRKAELEGGLARFRIRSAAAVVLLLCMVASGGSTAFAGSLDGYFDHWELEETITSEGTHREYLFETYDYVHTSSGVHAHEVGDLIFDETLAPNAYNHNSIFQGGADAGSASTYTYSHSLLGPLGNPNNPKVSLPVGTLKEFELEVEIQKQDALASLVLNLNSSLFPWNDENGPKEFSVEYEIGEPGAGQLLNIVTWFQDAGTIDLLTGELDRGKVFVQLSAMDENGDPLNFTLKKSEFELEYTAGGEQSVVPEPGTLALLASGLVLIGRKMRRRRAA